MNERTNNFIDGELVIGDVSDLSVLVPSIKEPVEDAISLEISTSSDEIPIEAETIGPVDKTNEYLSNSDSIWLKRDFGEFIKFADKSFQRTEDQWEEEGTEYFQLDLEKMEPVDLERLNVSFAEKPAQTSGTVRRSAGSQPALSDIRKVFVLGIKDSDLQTEIFIGGRSFYVEDSSGDNGDSWSVTYVSVD